MQFRTNNKKTEFLAIVYQFTRATDSFDDDGIPIIEETTEFTVNEIFYKLNLLNDKLNAIHSKNRAVKARRLR